MVVHCCRRAHADYQRPLQPLLTRKTLSIPTLYHGMLVKQCGNIATFAQSVLHSVTTYMPVSWVSDLSDLVFHLSLSPHVTLSVVTEVTVVIKGIFARSWQQRIPSQEFKKSCKQEPWFIWALWLAGKSYMGGKNAEQTTTWKQIYCLHFYHVFRHRERYEGLLSVFWTCTWLNPADSGKCNSTSAFWYNSNGLLCLLPRF